MIIYFEQLILFVYADTFNVASSITAISTSSKLHIPELPGCGED